MRSRAAPPKAGSPEPPNDEPIKQMRAAALEKVLRALAVLACTNAQAFQAALTKSQRDEMLGICSRRGRLSRRSEGAADRRAPYAWLPITWP